MKENTEDFTTWQRVTFSVFSKYNNISGIGFDVDEIGEPPFTIEEFQFALFEDAEELKDENRLSGFNLTFDGKEVFLASTNEGGIPVEKGTHYVLAFKLK